MIRAVVLRLHLAAAVVAAAPILVMAATGIVLSLENAAVKLSQPRLAALAPDAERMPVAELLQAARRSGALDGPFEAVSIRYEAARRAPVRLGSARGEQLFLDPYVGAALGRGSLAVAEFFEGVRAWHRWLAAPGGLVRQGRAVTGAANVALLFLLATGPLLWLPRPFNRRTFVASAKPLRGARGQARALSWHKVAGFWLAGPLLVIAASAVVLSYPRLGDRAAPVVGAALPLGSIVASSAVGARGAGDGRAGLDAALAAAERAAPEWRSIVVHVPREGSTEVAVEVRTGLEGQPQRAAAMTVDARTGVVVRWEAFGDVGPGRRGQQFFRHAHTGEYWGVAGQALAAIASLGAVCLVWTGMAMAWRRAVRRSRRPATEAPPPEP